MKPFITLVAMIALSGASIPAHANLDLATKNSCTACHATDKKILGPSYQDVARKYAGQKDAVAQITESIRKGGSGKWGAIPMPAQPALGDADLKTLATWIAGGAK